MGDSTAFKSSATSGHTEPFLSEEDVCGPILSSTSVARPATDKAWAVAFKINVAVNVISVRRNENDIAFVCLASSCRVVLLAVDCSHRSLIRGIFGIMTRIQDRGYPEHPTVRTERYVLSDNLYQVLCMPEERVNNTEGAPFELRLGRRLRRLVVNYLYTVRIQYVGRHKKHPQK